MSQFNYFSNTGGLANSILTETGNSGGAVPPDGFGNLGVIGVDGFNVTGLPGSNALNLTNLRNVSYYVVGPDATQSEYTSIQAAINQAVTDGADSNNPCLVWILPGIYSENVTLQEYVYLSSGSNGVSIVGNCSFTGNSGETGCYNLTFASPNTTTALNLTGSGTFRGNYLNIQGSVGNCLSIPSGNLVCNILNSEFLISGNTVNIFNINTGIVLFSNCIFSNTINKNVISGDAAVSIISSIFYGAGFLMQNTANLSLISCVMIDLSSNLSNIATSSANNLTIASSLFYSSNPSNYFIDGNGLLTYSNISPTGPANKLDPILGIAGSDLLGTNISFDGNTTRLNFNGGLIIGASGGFAPSLATLTPGSGIGITNGAGSITIDAIGTVSEVLGTSQSITSGVTYIANNAGSITFTLPATAAQGSFIKIIGKGAGTYTIAQNAGQIVHQGALSTTTGVTGVVTATQQYTSMHLVCITANLEWVIVDSSGTLTLA